MSDLTPERLALIRQRVDEGVFYGMPGEYLRELLAALDAAEKRAADWEATARCESDGLMKWHERAERAEKERDEARKYHTAETRDRKAAEARVAALQQALTEIAETSKDNRTRQIARAALSGSPPPAPQGRHHVYAFEKERQHEDDGA